MLEQMGNDAQMARRRFDHMTGKPRVAYPKRSHGLGKFLLAQRTVTRVCS